MKRFALMLAVALISACVQASPKNLVEKPAAYGWVVGSCLALEQRGAAPPTGFVLVDLSHGSRLTRGTVLRKASIADRCPALLPDRYDENTASGYTFYVVALQRPSDLGIAVAGGPPASDLSFQHCSTTEGIRFTVSRADRSVWTGYYYRGYDVDPTCPDAALK